MAQNKEQLNKLLLFIKRLIDEPGNEDFVNKLRKMLGTTPSSGFDTNPLLADIEKYLGLDYQIDSTCPIIDYSFIDDEFIRNQLISDFREMLRYRYGVRSHKIDFSEFCRYAILQIEQLLNYYYQNNFSSFESAKRYIINNVTWLDNTDKLDSVKNISLAVKLSAFSNKIGKKQRDCLDFAREVRNEQSHRRPEDSINSINEFKTKLIELGLPLTKEGEVFWNGIKDDDNLKTKYKSIDKSSYWRYRYQLWHYREPFREVIMAVQDVAQQIKTELETK